MGALKVVRKMGQRSGTRKGQGRGGCAPDVREKQQKEGEEEEKKVGRERRDEEERRKWSKGRERKSGKEGRIAGTRAPFPSPTIACRHTTHQLPAHYTHKSLHPHNSNPVQITTKNQLPLTDIRTCTDVRKSHSVHGVQPSNSVTLFL